MTEPQLATLKADILANTNTIPAGQKWTGSLAGVQIKDTPNNGEGNGAVAGWYSLNATPDFWAWRTAVSKAEFVQSTSVDATTFNWVGNGFITRSVGEVAAWRELFDSDGTCNPSLSSVRQAFLDIFSGTGNAAANRAHLSAVARRKVRRVEKLFATGTGSTASPGLMSLEGAITSQDAEDARNLP